MFAVLGGMQLFPPDICGQISMLQLRSPGLPSLPVGLEMLPSAWSFIEFQIVPDTQSSMNA